MRKLISIFIIAINLVSCNSKLPTDSLQINSPNNNLQLSFFLTENNTPAYTVIHKNNFIIDTSTIAIVLKNAPELKEKFSIIESNKNSFDETWEPIWGENKEIRNNYNELRVHLQEKTELKREFFIVFKIFNDGVGFRYEFPKQKHLNEVIILDEQTQFHLTGDHTAWWIPADFDSYEYHYTKSRVTEINAVDAGYEQRHDRHSNNLKAVNTPVTLKTDDGLYLSFHEANLTNYSGMTLAVKDDFILQSELVPALDGNTVKVQTPFITPWRTIQIAEKAGDLISSNLILNLNEPNVLENTSWIKPMKYNGVWWEIHIGKSSWDYGTGKHGANTANTKKYIDFAAKNNIHGVLVEGWNTGWKDWGDKTFSLTEPYPDFDIAEIVRYGKEKGVELIGHHETFGNVALYDSIVDSAFKYYSDLGIQNVKTGYAAGLLPQEFHHGQYMVNHYRKVVELAAKYHINVDVHEPIKATGIRRTYPNMMTQEGVKGMEYNAWGNGNPPDHTTIIPFTRCLGGPIDYTPGIFDIKFESEKKDQYVRSTLAKQLVLYVVLYSPLQMVADLPENYENIPAFQFIKDVPTDWDQTLVLNGEIGEFISIARKEKNTENWFVGSITNEEARELTISLDFLNEGKQYIAKVYSDADNTHWESKPTLYAVKEQEVSKNSELILSLAAGGGCAISIHLITKQNN
ncbi:MAG: glycoside hydrolase family 97 protein [Bacteroidales bacterium]|nr:glycoside hydrolase family 97 protein [Bacteroidales bacterium]